MKYRCIQYSCILASAWIALVCLASSASAQYAQYGLYGSSSLVEACHLGCRANQMWPAQYIPAARRSVYCAHEAMINNGWRRQNLLGTYHFDSETGELTEAGKLKVKWILSQTPQHRRSIFVERGADLANTADRVAAVQNWAASLSPSVGTIDVNDTHIVAEGHPAGTVDHIFVGFQTNQRPPVLPPDAGSSSSSSNSTN
ncbi:MAG: hypothetical protein KDA57_06820 [Planctomycetales bacterium]|nr:hypothetical protein [Planctomycetales bacterium]